MSIFRVGLPGAEALAEAYMQRMNSTRIDTATIREVDAARVAIHASVLCRSESALYTLFREAYSMDDIGT